ncbi:uncharacterized protein [Periplaneta americana]|uniref:uncharacterized protein isoform X2 n=1 Tax=Periplaneta americana TaxID=6978 RepID=UPI0037E79418
MQKLLILCLLSYIGVTMEAEDRNTSSKVNQGHSGNSFERAESRPPPPCNCAEGLCSCCTGFVLGQLGYDVRQRGCLNVTYDPDDFAFTVVLTYNDRVLYKNLLSGKNPEPVCVSVPRVPNIKLCAVFSNVYFAGRNVHMCIDMKGQWAGTTLFKVSFDCIRIGANGVAVVKPEDGGGLPLGTFTTDDDDDYDDVDEDIV